MKKLTKLGKKLYVPALVLACSIGFASCSDDDNNTPPVNITTDEMYGNYEGKMTTFTLGASEGEGDETTPVGADVATKVEKDTIYFDSFPIRDVVVSIVGEEFADKIVEAVGEVEYKIGYEAMLTEAQDSINFKLDPKPLMLAITVPSEGEEVKTLNIEVNVLAEKIGNYDIASTNQKFIFGAKEVYLVDGEDKTPIKTFKPTTFNLDMKKVKGE